MLSCHGASGPDSSTTLYFKDIRQVAAPGGRQTTTVFGGVHQIAATPGAKSAIYACLVTFVLLSSSVDSPFCSARRCFDVYTGNRNTSRLLSPLSNRSLEVQCNLAVDTVAGLIAVSLFVALSSCKLTETSAYQQQ